MNASMNWRLSVRRLHIADDRTYIEAADRSERDFPASVGAQPRQPRFFIGAHGDIDERAAGCFRDFAPIAGASYVVAVHA